MSYKQRQQLREYQVRFVKFAPAVDPVWDKIRQTHALLNQATDIAYVEPKSPLRDKEIKRLERRIEKQLLDLGQDLTFRTLQAS